MKLVHVCLLPQCLRFLNENRAYTQLYNTDEKNAYAYF